MKNCAMVLGTILAVGFLKSKTGEMNKKDPFKNVPKGQYFTIFEIAKFTGMSEYKIIQSLYALKRDGKVWENAGLYMFR
tara:strand:- start:219 stop:455 length:237 start_codon:yes stop_codon:yes gene_type:complete